MHRVVNILLKFKPHCSARARIDLELTGLMRDEESIIYDAVAERVANALRDLPYLPTVTINRIQFD